MPLRSNRCHFSSSRILSSTRLSLLRLPHCGTSDRRVCGPRRSRGQPSSDQRLLVQWGMLVRVRDGLVTAPKKPPEVLSRKEPPISFLFFLQ